jgi:zinc transport system ATP-binding protein
MHFYGILGCTTGNDMIEIKQLAVMLGGRYVLRDVHFSIAQGEVVTLVGPNGSGKTTLLRAMLGLIPIVEGSISKPDNLRIGYTPQRWHIDPSLPIHVKRFLTLGKIKLDMALLGHLGIEALLNSPMQSLSGGELQRVLLAKAIMRRPQLLVLDEPGQGVDVSGQVQLYDLINETRDRLGCAVLMASHDLHIVMAKTDKVICLNHHICCSGTPEAVQQHPEYLALFGEKATSLGIYTHTHDHEHT